MSTPVTHDPLVVNTADGTCWVRRAATRDGCGLYAPEGVCSCPEFVMATLAELAEHGIVGSADALPVPVGPEPQAPRSERLAEIAARVEAATAGPWCTDGWEIYQGASYVAGAEWIGETCRPYGYDGALADAQFIAHAREDVPLLLARVAELEAQRDRRRERLVALQNDALNMRGALSPNGEDRKVPMPLGDTLTPAVEWLINRVAELEAERHSTNDVLAEQTVACRKAEARVAELETTLANAALDLPLDDPDRHALDTDADKAFARLACEHCKELTVFRAGFEGHDIPLGLYQTTEAARAHGEAYVRREYPAGAQLVLTWSVDEDEPNITELDVEIGGRTESTGYIVTAVTVASEYDEAADE